ncbi:hypothetical protein HaLaN_23957, partial [Haematococcus lacustris]
ALQALSRQHEETSRRLAARRQQILTHQAVLLGNPLTAELDKARQVAAGVGAAAAPDAKSRREARVALVKQLAEEQGAAEAMLQALKQGLSLASARQQGLAAHQQALAQRSTPSAPPSSSQAGWQPPGGPGAPGSAPTTPPGHTRGPGASPPGLGWAGLDPEELDLEPRLTAAQARHQHDMAFMRMDIERARTTAELEQAQAQLRALRLTTPH